jgi:hypothetical protein
LAPERLRLSRSNEAIALAIARGLIPVRRPNPQQGFLTLRTVGELHDGEQPMSKEFSSHGESSGHRGAEHIRRPLEPSEATPEFKRPGLNEPGGGPRPWPGGEDAWRTQIEIRRPKAPGLPRENVVAAGPPEPRFRLVSHGEGRFTVESVTHDFEVGREKFIDAIGDYLAGVIGNPLFSAATKSWETESNPVTGAMDAIEGVSGWLEGAVDAPLKGLSTALGLAPGEAAFTAGVSTNLILAPITGPLDKAESYIGVGGIIFGIVTGGHGLVLACIKPLLHQQLHHALAHAVVEAFGGSRKDPRRSPTRGAIGHNLRLPSDVQRTASRQNVIQPMPRHPEQQNVFRPTRFPMPQGAPENPRQPAPREPLWLCLAFAPRPSPNSGAIRTAGARTAPERDATKPVVLPFGDDAFLSMLPETLRRGSVTEVDVPMVENLSNPPRGQHFVLKMKGVGLGTAHTRHGSLAAYQHPGCLTGRCVPAGSPPCLCPCSVCRPYRPPA